MAEPIWIPCEGSGCPTNLPDSFTGLCQMCGRGVTLDDDGRAKPHVRDDIIARIERGDFDPAPAGSATPTCRRCGGEGVIERLATPDEVSAGCELGIAFDPCPDCDPDKAGSATPTGGVMSELVLCPHCGLYVDPSWGSCAHDPATPDWLVRARLRPSAGSAAATGDEGL